MDTQVPDLDTVWLTRLLKENYHMGKPADLIDVTIKSAVPKGDNYTSTVSRVKVRCLLASGKKKSFSIIVKTELISEKAKEVLADWPIFRSEIHAYTSTLAKMEALADEFEDKREILWAAMYGYKPYNLVAFEDLTDSGYAVAPRRDFLSFKHAQLVLRNVARFHAMGKVLLSRGLLNDDDKGFLAIASDNESMAKMWEVVMLVISDCLEKDWGSEWGEIAGRIRNLKDVMAAKIRAVANEYDKRFEVLNHGDLWTCNIMFKNMEFENDPVSVRLLDFQLNHLNSFIWDVEYFLNTSVDPKVRRASKPQLLKIYQESLAKNLEFFKYSGYVPTLDDVESESKRIEFGQFAVTTFNPIMSADTTDAMDIEKVMTHAPEEVIKREVYNTDRVKENMGEDLRRFAANGTI